MSALERSRKIGIVGFGSLGKFLYDEIPKYGMDVCFVWNRSRENTAHLKTLVLDTLESVRQLDVDLVVEVAHPDVTREFGQTILEVTDLMIGSPSVLSDAALMSKLKMACAKFQHSVYVPVGALWGAEDIQKMADNGKLKNLTVTMRKHPSCLKLLSPLKELNEEVTTSARVIFEGPVSEVCVLAPNNVNTMAAAAIAGHNLGFHGVRGRLVSDPNLLDRHMVEVVAEGEAGFRVQTTRFNPSQLGAVTALATFHSFLSSIRNIQPKRPGFHLC